MLAFVYWVAAAGVAAVRGREGASAASGWIPTVAAGLYAAYGPLNERDRVAARMP